jgi:hypothetical protein
MELKYILKMCITAFFIISLIMFINAVGLNFNAEPVPIEGMASSNNKSYAQKKEEAESLYKKKCGSKKNTTGELCNKVKFKDDFFEHTKYCIWTNANKCIPGDEDGRKYDAKTKLDYYYFKSKCYGNCPKVA